MVNRAIENARICLSSHLNMCDSEITSLRQGIVCCTALSWNEHKHVRFATCNKIIIFLYVDLSVHFIGSHFVFDVMCSGQNDVCGVTLNPLGQAEMSDIVATRLSFEISHTRTDLTASSVGRELG